MPAKKGKQRKKGVKDATVAPKQLIEYEAGDVIMFKWNKNLWPGVVIDVAEKEIAARFAHSEDFT